MIEGKVIYVSADTVIDQGARRTGDQEEPQGETRSSSECVLTTHDLRNKVENFRPTPGMPADIFIETGQRTFVTYLMRPVADSFSRAFREH